MTRRNLAAAGAILSGVGVALGAFGAHALRDSVAVNLLDTFETGVRYQMYHGLALLALAALYDNLTPTAAKSVGWLFVLGTMIFSGSLYILVLTALPQFGAITPIGGVLMLFGWLILAGSLIRKLSR